MILSAKNFNIDTIGLYISEKKRIDYFLALGKSDYMLKTESVKKKISDNKSINRFYDLLKNLDLDASFNNWHRF